MRIFHFIIIFLFGLFLPTPTFCQLGAIYYNGAFSAGLQGYSNHQGTEAIFTNPAGIASANNKYGAIFNYSDQYGLGEISKIAIGGRLKTGSGHFSIGLYQYGIEEYKEQSLTFSYARSFLENFNLGIQFNHNRLAINTFNTVSQNGVNIGLQTKLTKTLILSAIAANMLKTQSNNYSSPPQFQFGITYQPSHQIAVLLEAIKQSERPLSGIIALNYLPSNNINFRLGADISKGEIGLSAFYNMSKIKVGLGYSSHQHLSGSYSLSGLIN